MALCKNCKKFPAREKFCSRHCHNAYRKRPEVIIQRFWKHVTRGEDNECWVFSHKTASSSYQTFKYRRGSKIISKSAHVFSYILAHGKVPKGKIICHTCDVPRCVNPNHLFPGTYAENAQDCVAKGRYPHAKGEDSRYHKFTDEIVLLCRKLLSEGYSQREIGEIVGMSQRNVSDIARRRTWTHI